jgi:small conductance mechanosensitive channel
MSKVGIPVSGFMAVLATAGFAIGLAFQGTLSNFSAGILLLVFRPFKVGDSVIVSNNVMGEVNEIDIFTTTLDTPDNRRLIIPNSSIASCTIENMSFHRHRRVDLTVGVEYSASVERTRQALIECVESLGPSMVAGEDRGYQVILKHLGPSSVDWMLRVWVMRQDYHAVKERLIQKVKQTLHQYQIGIPFPQMHLHMSPAAAAAIEATQSAEKVTASRSLADPVSPITMPQLHPPQSPSRIRPRARSGEQSSQPGLPPNS